jgi:trans-2-enoyl-CoA reductase
MVINYFHVFKNKAMLRMDKSKTKEEKFQRVEEILSDVNIKNICEVFNFCDKEFILSCFK